MSLISNFETLLFAFLLLALLAVVLVSLSWAFQRAWNNMPLVASHQGLEATIAEHRQILADLKAQIESDSKERQISVSTRDQAAAELTVLEGRIAEARAELATLAEGRKELDAYHRELQVVLEQRAEAIQDLDVKRNQLAEVEVRSETAERRMLRAEEAIVPLKEQEDALRATIAQLQPQAEEARRLRAELSGLLEDRERLSAELRADQVRLESTQTRLEELKSWLESTEEEAGERDGILAEVQAEKNQLEALVEKKAETEATVQRLEARRAQIEAEIERHKNDSEGVSVDIDIAELLETPRCLVRQSDEGLRESEEESEALKRVEDHLRSLGLEFEPRAVKAFHTALKINEISPMTVLAGISGTGKSQLPRRYAEAMGINFLQVAVQPRWDSPQDLLGFYNYIEKNYRATELAQAMVHLDPWNWPEQAEPYADQMLLVLLDEMNLARVEYYFSDFLSRLEARPSLKDEKVEDRRRPAEIAIDLPHQSKWLYPGHNVLFAGTMNEDESTQTLSDKVLDRSNVMQFSRPRSFDSVSASGEEGSIAKPLSFELWQLWVSDRSSMPMAASMKAKETISKLSDLMASCGRAFGHRLSQAVLAYVANHPDTQADDGSAALADQIEMRILPRLRGVEGEDAAQKVQQLVDLVRENLEDPELAEAIGRAAKEAEGAGIFAWRGRQT